MPVPGDKTGGEDPVTVTPFLKAEVERASQDPKNVFGRFVLLGELGKGGMGAVYRAFDQRLRRQVALKTILPWAESETETVKRFYREAEAVARLRHPNIVSVHEAGEVDGRHYLAMDYIEGETLSRRLGKGKKPLPLDEAAAIIRDVARAVHHAHQQGVIHRDLKPQNIIIDRSGTPFVLDFGIARVRDAETKLTRTGTGMGTPAYMAPEQTDSGAEGAVDHRSDVYALGSTLYHTITGRPPFEGESDYKILTALLTKEPKRPSELNPETAGELETICLRCLVKDRAERYPTAAALANDLDRYLEGDEITARAETTIQRLARSAKKNALVTVLATCVAILGIACIGLASYVVSQGRRTAQAEPTREPGPEATASAPTPEPTARETQSGTAIVATSAPAATTTPVPTQGAAPTRTPEPVSSSGAMSTPSPTAEPLATPAPPEKTPEPTATATATAAPTPSTPPMEPGRHATVWRRVTQAGTERIEQAFTALFLRPSARMDPKLPLGPTPVLAFGADTALYQLGSEGTWKQLAPLKGFHPHAIAGDARVLYLAGQGGCMKSTDLGAHWRQTGITDDCYAVAVDPREPGTFYAGPSDGILKSTDGGETPQRVGPVHSMAWVALVTDPKTSDIAYGGVQDRIFRTTNGKDWNPIWMPANSRLFALALDPAAPERVYAATSDGLERRRDERGFEAVTSAQDMGPALSVAIDPTSSDGKGPCMTVYVGSSQGRVYKTIDGCRTWHAIGLGLPQHDVKALVVDPLNPLVATALVDGEGVWQTVTGGSTWSDRLPFDERRDPHGFDRMVWDGRNTIYAFGGTGNAPDGNGVYSYDSTRNAWTAEVPNGSPDSPTARGFAGLAWDGSKLWLMGGGNPLQGQRFMLNDLWTYEPGTKRWEEIHPTGALPAPRCEHSLLWDGKELLLFGGADGAQGSRDHYWNDTWAFDPGKKTWTQKKPDGDGSSPEARMTNGTMVWDGKEAILWSGRGSKGLLDDLWSYDPAKNAWTKRNALGPKPPPRCNFSTTWDGKRMLVFGGLDRDWRSGFNDLWAYEPRANAWMKLLDGEPVPELPARMCSHLAWDGQRAVLFGHWDPAARRFLNDTWWFGPPEEARNRAR